MSYKVYSITTLMGLDSDSYF